MSGASAAEYVAIPYNGATNGSLPLAFTGSGIQAANGPPNPNLVPTGNPRLLMDGTGLTAFSDIGSSTDDAMAMASSHLAFQNKLRNGLPSLASRIRRSQAFVTTTSSGQARSIWYPAGSKTVANRAQSAQDRASLSITSGVPVVGDFMILDGATTCNATPSLRTGIVRSISQHAIIVADTANPAGGFTAAQYDSIGLEFDSVAYAVDTANFGGPTDLDANGRVVIFYTRAVNELSPSPTTFATGFFANKDLFAGDSIEGCLTSNEGEMIYMMVPDPTGVVNSNVRSVSFVRNQSGPTLVHNLEHLIGASRRMYVNGASQFEDLWLDEGLANVALELAFYRTSFGLLPRQNIGLAELTEGPNAAKRISAFNSYENTPFTYLRSWLARPDTTGALLHASRSDLTATGSVAPIGALWAFLRYASDRVNNSDAAFWYSLV